MGLQPHLILRVLYRILIFTKYFLFSILAPPGLATFLCHCRYNISALVHTVPPKGNIALAHNFLSSGEFDSVVSQVHLLSTILTQRNSGGYTRVVLAIVQPLSAIFLNT